MEAEFIAIICLAVVVFMGLIFIGYMTYLEEKRKCKHKWEETNRLVGRNGWGSIVTDVHLRCVKCGDIKKRTL